MMQLLENIPSEVYNANFPESVVISNNQSFHEGPAAFATSSIFPLYFPRGDGVVCAEDPEWDRGLRGSGLQPPRLSTRCVQVMAKFFRHKPKAGSQLRGGDRAKFLVLLSTSEPLNLTCEYIPDELYWKRCCQEQLKASFDVALHGNSWKRMYLERHLQTLIENYVPLKTEMFDIKDILPTIEPFVKRLEITQLLSPTVYMAPGQTETLDEDETLSTSNLGDGADSDIGERFRSVNINSKPEINMRVPHNHFDFGAVLPMLSNIEEIHLCFKVKKCGTDFRWNMFGMTVKDADSLGSGLRVCKKLRIVKISNSRMDDDRFYAIYDGIKNLNSLEELSFPNNSVTDESIDCLVKLLNGPNNIRKLDFTNNLLGCDGAKKMASYLSSAGIRTHLTHINLSLNNVREPGCSQLCKAVGLNKTIRTLNLSSNRIDHRSCPAIRDMIRLSTSLETLILSCNSIGESGGRILCEGVKMSKSLTKIDLRMAKCGREVDSMIQSTLQNRSHDLEM